MKNYCRPYAKPATASLRVCGILLVLASASPVGFAVANAKKVQNYRDALHQQSSLEGARAVADLHVVDCLLPGKVRRLGNTTYLGPRRPIQTTAADCRLRGGEYTAYDRADYRSALQVWMASAEAGDAEAQTHVAEIFERGLGGEPNYPAAHIWYERAALQGYTRAQFALGTLYEQGLGVPTSKLEALNWYRKAWGIEDDNVMFTSTMRAQVTRELQQQTESLQAKIRDQQAQIDILLEDINALRSQGDQANAAETEARLRADTLQRLVDQLQQQRTENRSQLSDLQAQLEARLAVTTTPASQGELRLREPAGTPQKPPASAAEDGLKYQDLALGNYYALLIGNSEYQQLDDLQTPLNDIARARKVLEEQYGFTVFTLDNGNSIEVMQAINNLADVLTENDNLLLFFAGHGSRLETGERESGYWLPRNAEPPPRNTFWVSNEFVSGHLARFSAKRILVVADSCYAGLLAKEPSLSLLGVDAPQYTNPEFLEFKLSKRARLLLSSGGDKPVLDQGSNNHSVFANAFLSALENNDGLLATPQLFLQIQSQVEGGAAQYGFEQAPQLQTIKSAGHEVGDFFFVAQ